MELQIIGMLVGLFIFGYYLRQKIKAKKEK